MKTTKKESYILARRDLYESDLLKRRSSTYWEGYTRAFALVMLLVFPLLMGLNGYTAITEGKYILFKILSFAYIGGCALIVVGFTMVKKDWRSRRAEGFQKLSWPQILLMAWAAWGLLSALISPYENLWEGQSRYEGVLSMLLYTAVFVLVGFWGEYSRLYLPAMAVMALAQGVVSILQICGVDLIYPQGYDFRSTLFVGFVGNIDCMGGIVAVTVPALVCGFILLKNRWRYAMLAGAAILFAVEIFIDVDSAKMGLLTALVVALPFLLTERRHVKNTLYAGAVLAAVMGICKWLNLPHHTRGSAALLCVLLGAAALMGAAGFFTDRCKLRIALPAKTIRLIVLGAEVLAVIAALLYVSHYSGGNTLLMNARDLLHGHLSDDAGNYRGFVWKACLVLMGEKPILGYGPGSFMEVFAPYNRPELGVVYDFAHNDFLQIGVCMGCVGLALYLAFIVVLAVRVLKNADRCPLLVIFASSAAGYLVHSFFGFSIAIVAPVFWVLAGLMEKLVRQLPEETAPSAGKKNNS